MHRTQGERPVPGFQENIPFILDNPHDIAKAMHFVPKKTRTTQPVKIFTQQHLMRLLTLKKDGDDGLVQVGTNRQGVHGIAPTRSSRSRSRSRGSDRSRSGSGGLLLGDNLSGSASGGGNWCGGGYRCRRLGRGGSGLRLGRSYRSGSSCCRGCRHSGSGGGSRRIGIGHVVMLCWNWNR